MASSRADAATPSPVAFALQELIACWDQAYEALLRGDLDRVQALLDVADDHAARTGDAAADSPHEARLRDDARSARGRLEHGMKAGLTGLQEELGRARRGAKALRGYGNPTLGVGDHVLKQA